MDSVIEPYVSPAEASKQLGHSLSDEQIRAYCLRKSGDRLGHLLVGKRNIKIRMSVLIDFLREEEVRRCQR